MKLLSAGNEDKDDSIEGGAVCIDQLASLIEEAYSMKMAVGAPILLLRLAQLRRAVNERTSLPAAVTSDASINPNPNQSGLPTLSSFLIKAGMQHSVCTASTLQSLFPLLGLSPPPSIEECNALTHLISNNSSSGTAGRTSEEALMCWLRARSVPSPRTVQSRVHVTFRALPSLLKDLQTTLIKTKEGGREGVVSISDFCDCVRDSNAPLSTTESLLLAQLLCRGGVAVMKGGKGGKNALLNADVHVKSVEIVHLERIKKGELLQNVRA